MADTELQTAYTDRRIKEVSPGMWQDFYDQGRPFSKMSIYYNDFHSWVADEWTVTEVGTSLQVLTDLRNGVLRLTSGASENDGTQLQLGGSSDSETVGECFAPENGKNLWFETRVKYDDVTESDFFIGLHIQDTAIIASLGADYIGFMKDDGDALIDIRNAAGSSASVQAGVKTMVDATWVTLGFKVTGLDKIEWYVNGSLVATTNANITTELMKLSIAQLTGEANAASFDIDYVIVAQDR